MRFLDLLSMALLMIRQQKTRVVLSLVGIVIGSLMLLFAVASRRSVQDAVARVFSASERMRQIQVYTRWHTEEEEIPPEALAVEGAMDDATRARIREMLVRRWQMEHGGQREGLTQARIEAIEAIPHVRRVHPSADVYVDLLHAGETLAGRGEGIAADNAVLAERILAGRGFATDNEPSILLSEFVAWSWGYISPEEQRRLIGTKVTIEQRYAEDTVADSIRFRSGGEIDFSKEEIAALNRALDRLPTVIDQLPWPEAERAALQKAFPPSAAEDAPRAKAPERIIRQVYTVTGVFRGPTPQEMDDGIVLGQSDGFTEFLVPIKTATGFALRTPYIKQSGFHSATVYVEHETHLKSVARQIREMGFHEQSLISTVEYIQARVREVTLVVSLVALFALVISAVGITNTMVMSVVERTREIGVMKAVGARERQIQLLFLAEGGSLGLIGGLVALLLGVVIRIPIESWMVSLLESDLNKSFEQERLIAFPLWLLATVLGFAAVVTTLATILPAWRASRVDPITALRHD